MFVSIDEQIAVGLVSVSADASAELMEFGQTVAIGIIDEDGIGVGDIESALDDRGCEENISAMLDKIQHDLFQPILWHLPVSDDDAGFGDNPLESGGDMMHVLDTVIDKENLAIAVEFPKDGVSNQCIIPTHNAGFNRHPFFRCRF